MLTADRAARMLEAQTFADCAKLLVDCGYEDMTGLGAAGVDAALSSRRAGLFAEIELLVPDKELVELFRLKYDYHNAKTVLKAEAMGSDPLRLMSVSGRVAPEKLKSDWDEERTSELPKALGEAMVEAGSTLARTANPQLADFDLDRACFAEMKAIADGLDNAFISGYVRLLIDAANLKSVVRTARMHTSADFLSDVLLRGATDVDRLSGADADSLAAVVAHPPLDKAAAAGGEQFHPGRHLDALVHRLRRAIQARGPVDQLVAGALGVRHGQADAFDRRTVGFPLIQPQVALDLQRGIEHALAGHDLAAADVIGLAVGDHGHLVALVQQAQGQRQAGLPASDDRDSTHDASPFWCAGPPRSWRADER